MKPPFAFIVATIAFILFLSLGASGVTQDFDREMSRIAEQVTSAADFAGVKTVATVDFVDLNGDVSALGRFIAEELSTDLVLAKKKLSIVDRANLKHIMEEHKLTMTGLVDPENAKKLGQFAGVDAFVIGTITPFEKNIRVSIKIISTDSAKIVGAVRGDLAKTESLEELLGKSAAASDSPFAVAGRVLTKQKVFDLARQITLSVDTIRFTENQFITVAGTITNKTSSEIAVFAGGDGNLQKLHMSAVDDSGKHFIYKSVDGFTRLWTNQSHYTLYDGTNQYVVIQPNDSAAVTFYLQEVSRQYVLIPQPIYDIPKTIDLTIEFRIMMDVRGKKYLDKTASFRNCNIQ